MDDEARLTVRLEADEWLSTGEVAVLLHVSRWTVTRALDHGFRIGDQLHHIGYEETPGGQRRCDPVDVQAVIAARQDRRTSTQPTGTIPAPRRGRPPRPGPPDPPPGESASGGVPP